MNEEISKETGITITGSCPENTVAIFNEGNSVIVVDDHCYLIKNWNGGEWGLSAYIFKEAIKIIKSLPDNPDDALTEQ